MATDPSADFFRITVEQFLAIKWDDPDAKAELDNGIIRMMAGGSGAHGRIQVRVLGALLNKLREGDCSPYGSDTGLRTNDLTLRHPDAAVYCGRDNAESDALTAFDDPVVVIEVLSPSTRKDDFEKKLPEYRAIASVRHIVFIDIEPQSIRLFTRTGPKAWNDVELSRGEDIVLDALNITLTWEEVFGRRTSGS